jgi:hypothetical protein
VPAKVIVLLEIIVSLRGNLRLYRLSRRLELLRTLTIRIGNSLSSSQTSVVVNYEKIRKKRRLMALCSFYLTLTKDVCRNELRIECLRIALSLLSIKNVFLAVLISGTRVVVE